MKYGDFVYFSVSQNSADLVFVGTVFLTENYFREITKPIGNCKH